MKRQPSSLGSVDLVRWLRLTTPFLALILVCSIVVDAGAMLAQENSDKQNSLPPGWVNPSDPNLNNHTIFLTYDRIDENRFLAKLQAEEEQRLASERAEFLRDVDERLGQLKEHLGKANALRLTLEQKDTSTARRSQAQKDFRESMGMLEGSAQYLHEKLAPAIPGMESSKNLQLQGKDTAAKMEFIGRQIETVETQFRRQPGQIMQWPGEETILVCLDWVEEIARTVRESY